VVIDDYNSVRNVQDIHGPPPDYPLRVIKTIGSHLEAMKPLFDQVSVSVADLTVQAQP